jgi:putative tricarboxylic transport membrane protein
MFLESMLMALDVKVLFLVAIGSAAGVTIGALPGLSVSMATALLVSITFGWSMEYALAMIIGVFCGGVFGGSISAVLLNIPGAPGAICTGFDGYPLAQRGEASFALGLARIGSFIGGIIGIICLATFAPIIARIALAFGPFEYLSLVILGLITIGNLSQGSFLKALISGLIGLLISCVGMDQIYGIGRFTFGNINLAAGIGLIPCLIGFFGMSEVLVNLKTPSGKAEIIKQLGKVIPKMSTFIKMLPLILRSSLLGTWIGALPGVGGAVAALLAYDNAKRTVKNPSRPFGEGAYEGVVAPEVANNAGIGGALIPLLTLGIPGDAVTAIMIGAFMTHGLRPGPLLMVQSPKLFWYIVVLLVVANIMFLFIGLAATKYFPRILMISKETLMPIVIVLCVVGAYGINNSTFDILVMVLAGVVGYILKLANYPVGPLVIGLVLGPLADGELRRSVMISKGDFFGTFLHHPISIIILLFALLQILNQTTVFKNFSEKVIGTVVKKNK